MKAIVYPWGARVRLRRGCFPLDPSLVGSVGTVVRIFDDRPDLYGVVLDGEGGVRQFFEEELEAEGDEVPGSPRGELI